MFGSRRLPAPADAVHVSDNGRRSLCGQDMRGEPHLGNGTKVTCPVCCKRNNNRAQCGCR